MTGDGGGARNISESLALACSTEQEHTVIIDGDAIRVTCRQDLSLSDFIRGALRRLAR